MIASTAPPPFKRIARLQRVLPDSFWWPRPSRNNSGWAFQGHWHGLHVLIHWDVGGRVWWASTTFLGRSASAHGSSPEEAASYLARKLMETFCGMTETLAQVIANLPQPAEFDGDGVEESERVNQ